jgi:hypothetical protein
MGYRPRTIIIAASFLLSCALALAAENGAPGARTYCADPKPFREVAQDEIKTIPELCGWRDDSLHDREMTLVQRDEPSAPKINLSMEQRHVIKEIVLKDIKPNKAAIDVNLAIGDVVPPGVELQPFPPEVSAKVPQIKSHAFFVRAEQVIVVNPKDNKIEDIID